VTREKLLGGAARRRVLRIAAVVSVLVAAVLLLDWARGTAAEDEWFAANAMDAPIPSEADVFRIRPGDLAVEPGAEPRAGARRRSLADFRGLRAYPGAPPSIPHPLSADEFRGMTCNSCHEAGGYSARFSAYVPVTPHPEYGNCLQCHTADAAAVDFAVPGGASGLRPARQASRFAGLDWRTTEWPRIDQRAMEGSPPIIPHDLHMRGNCLSCHGGPSAVAEIRTTHPERANCRQCHVLEEPVVGEGLFSRPVRGTTGGER
jgi:nitrate reductase (cytochrome), electron transfer subunit